MEINATLIIQLIVFAVLVWFTLKYVWPLLTNVMSQREKKIADGLLAAERAKQELEIAQHKVLAMLKEAKSDAAHIIEQANQRAIRLMEEGRETARLEGERIIKQAREEIEREVSQAREALRQQLASLAVLGAGKIIRRNLDAAAHDDLLKEFVAEI
ncbi:MAG: F0F1 ATP synthase subunit B [Gammaproteobacteria bacterium]|nr:F0F1 ATP synthase subunit B [Gammaproteobacteria bacterium]